MVFDQCSKFLFDSKLDCDVDVMLITSPDAVEYQERMYIIDFAVKYALYYEVYCLRFGKIACMFIAPNGELARRYYENSRKNL